MSTKLIYSTRTSGFQSGASYRNPRFFDRPEAADEVVIEGDYPNIKAAYEAAGVKVSASSDAASKPAPKAKTQKQPKPEPKD